MQLKHFKSVNVAQLHSHLNIQLQQMNSVQNKL